MKTNAERKPSQVQSWNKAACKNSTCRTEFAVNPLGTALSVAAVTCRAFPARRHSPLPAGRGIQSYTARGTPITSAASQEVELRPKRGEVGFLPTNQATRTWTTWPLGGDLSPARGRARLPSAGAGCLAPSPGQELRLKVSHLGGEVSGVFRSRNTSKCALRHNRASCLKRWEMSPAVFL